MSSNINLLEIPNKPVIIGFVLNVELICKLLIYYNFSISEDNYYNGKSLNNATLKLDNNDKCIKLAYLSIIDKAFTSYSFLNVNNLIDPLILYLFNCIFWALKSFLIKSYFNFSKLS